jgi:peptide/nickel transport system ATP-binding protein
MADDSSIMLSVEELKLFYRTRRGARVDAVKGVSFQLKRGKVLGVAGESGCGKSTLMKGIMGLTISPLFHSSGKVIIGGEDIFSLSKEQLRVEVLGKKISIIPQGAMNCLNPTRKIRKFAIDVLSEHEPNLTNADIEKRLNDRFLAIGLEPSVLDSFPVELSGGMKQRVVIAISTLMNPDVVIADEPTSALDVSTQKSVIIMLKDLMKKGYFGSMIFITHELPLLYHVADDIAVMHSGQIVEIGDCEQIIHAPTDKYTKMLMREAKKLDAHGARHGDK